MKKFTLVFLPILLLSLVLCACTTQPEPQDPTGTPTTTAPVTTPPTTELPTTESATKFYSDAYMQAQGFEPGITLNDISDNAKLWTYCGDSNVISLPHCGIQLTIPQDWMGRVSIYVFQYANSTGRLYIANSKLMTAHYENNVNLPWYDSIVSFWYDDMEVSKDWADGCELVQRNNLYYIYFTSCDMHGANGSEGEIYKYMLIEKIGQAAYDELVGDLFCTREQAREMIFVTDANPDLAYAD